MMTVFDLRSLMRVVVRPSWMPPARWIFLTNCSSTIERITDSMDTSFGVVIFTWQRTRRLRMPVRALRFLLRELRSGSTTCWCNPRKTASSFLYLHQGQP